MSTNSDAIDALKKQRQRIAFDANVQRVYQIGTPYAISCLERYEKITAQIAELEGPRQGQLFKVTQ